MKRSETVGVIIAVCVAVCVNVAFQTFREIQYAQQISNLESIIQEQEAQIRQLEKEKKELEEIAKQVREAEMVIHQVNPEATPAEVRHLATRQVGKARKYGIPVDLVIYRDWAEADLRWLDAGRCGPCGEVSTAQVWRPTFYRLRPKGNFHDVDEVYDAGCEYLAHCYQTAKQWLPKAEEREVYRLALAFYNAGAGRRPSDAMKVAAAHVKRVNGIFARAEGLFG